MDVLQQQLHLESGFLIQTNFKAHFSEVSNFILSIDGVKINYNLTTLIFYFTDFEGGIKIGEMLFRTNIIGFVGTGNNTSYPSNRLILWDDI